jgi:hypothetical protein
VDRQVHGNASVQNTKEFIDSLDTGDLVCCLIDLEDVDVRVLGDTSVLMSWDSCAFK